MRRRPTQNTWLMPDIDAANRLFNLYDRSVFPLGIEPALNNNYTIEEEDIGGFVQADFRTEVMGHALRANLGVRYVETRADLVRLHVHRRCAGTDDRRA